MADDEKGPETGSKIQVHLCPRCTELANPDSPGVHGTLASDKTPRYYHRACWSQFMQRLRYWRGLFGRDPLPGALR